MEGSSWRYCRVSVGTFFLSFFGCTQKLLPIDTKTLSHDAETINATMLLDRFRKMMYRWKFGFKSAMNLGQDRLTYISVQKRNFRMANANKCMIIASEPYKDIVLFHITFKIRRNIISTRWKSKVIIDLFGAAFIQSTQKEHIHN